MPGLTGTVPAPELPPGPRLALVIATATYSDPGLQQLRSPARDAADLTRVLGDPEVGGFTVTPVIDAPAQDIRLAVEDFLADRGTQDLLLVYMSCHGLLDQHRRLYFAARDTRKNRLGATGVEAAWVLDQLEHCRARRQILILDSCFSGAFARGAKGDAEVRLENRFAGHGRGRIVLTASNATEYSFEGELVDPAALTGSMFTAALVAGLRTGAADADGDGYISVDDAYVYAYEQVKASEAAQTPQRWLYGAEGTIVLARSPAGQVVTPAPLPESLRTALESPHASVRSGAVQELGAWLTGDDQARLLTARAELARITEGDISRVADLARRYVAPQQTSNVQPTAVHHAPVSQPASRPGPSHAASMPPAEPSVVISARRGQVLTGHGQVTLAVAFSRDGRLLATGGNDKTIRLWDTSTGEQRQMSVTAPSVDAMAFSEDGRLLAGCAGNTVLLWDTATGQHVRSLDGLESGMHAVAFANDGELRAVGSASLLLRRWRTDTGVPLNTIKLPQRWPRATALLDSSASQRHRRYIAGHSINDTIVFSDDGNVLAVGSGESVRLWTANSGWRRIVIKADAQVSAVTFGTNPDQLATCDDHDTFCVWDIPSARRRTIFRGNRGSITQCPLSLHSDVLATSGYQAIELWNTVTGAHLGSLQPEIDNTSLPSTTHSNSLSRITDNTSIFRSKTARAPRAQTARVYPSYVRLVFSPDGSVLAASEATHISGTSSWSSRVQLWHLEILKQHTAQ